MNSREYKAILRTIAFNLLKKRFPTLDKKHLTEVAYAIGVSIHARMYGANVDGVDSPIWTSANGSDRNNDSRIKPNIEASELLKHKVEVGGNPCPTCGFKITKKEPIPFVFEDT